MAIIVVEVMPKKELLDPAGKAVLGAFHRSGIERFHEVRIGKRFELHIEGDATEAHLADARKMAEDLLSNGVIEDVLDVRVEDSPA
ncbi:MAG: phosphoribosylformylglycinamidine synthase subunit PurS [Pontimonas sp.]